LFGGREERGVRKGAGVMARGLMGVWCKETKLKEERR